MLTFVDVRSLTCQREGVLIVPNYMEELKKRGLTLREFASRVGVSATHVSAVFRGKAPVSEETEKKMRAILGECPWCHRKWQDPLPEKALKS